MIQTEKPFLHPVEEEERLLCLHMIYTVLSQGIVDCPIIYCPIIR
jgi:hypothetical protein